MKFKLVKLFVVIILVLQVMNCSRQQQSEPAISREKARDYANVLYNRQLFKQSVEQYEHYMNSYNLDESELAKISYVVGDIYFERLRDYENALAYYLKVKYLFNESNLVEDANKKIVVCLERLDRSEDAAQALQETAALDPSLIKKKRPGAIVAKIGKREITQGDIDFEFNQLPSYIQSQFSTKEKKLQFLQQYILTELLYDKAVREQLDKDPEIIEAAFQAKKQVMVQKLLQKEVQNKVQIKPEDVELYYNAHKDKYVEKDEDGNVTREKSFNEVQQQVAQDLGMERQQQVVQRLTDQLMRAENAQIYDDVLK